MQDRTIQFHHDTYPFPKDLLQAVLLPLGHDLRAVSIFEGNAIIQRKAVQEDPPAAADTEADTAAVRPDIEGQIVFQQFQQTGLDQATRRHALQTAEAVLPNAIEKMAGRDPPLLLQLMQPFVALR